ncbi:MULTISPECIES: carbohydrate ABC transporter permease [unclassified Rathayibacter]|uniref:carbohydrate ABC transporter permease n=1 Tax=unclassified Rathayibacter TaxID=2609250 RepID=UPI0006F815D3|nr:MULTISPECIES: carbohydrate ABC transporter permease [unclassified Rathayibacter]KQQ05561.1 ABC transporter permease [Rathayibacter sp. Leaf294]KQS13424.1 ABC transporter permease [Rathayibacter sp. Leaf185]
MAVIAPIIPAGSAPKTRPRRVKGSWIFHAVMGPIAVLWVLPMVFVLFVAVRSFDDITSNGLGALPASFSFDGFVTVFTAGLVGEALVNSVIVTVFTVLLSLLLASWAAFALSRFAIPFRRGILLLMLAGNLLPPQILLIPVSRITEGLGIYDTLFALIVVQVGFGLGFYTFVLHGFMRSIPVEIFEAAQVDGAGAIRTYWRIILPLCRPSLAALGALATTWIWNDLIWAVTVLRTETNFPITAALLNIQGGYVSQWNVVASGAVIAAIPTAIVFFAFQKQFVSGLTLGSGK